MAMSFSRSSGIDDLIYVFIHLRVENVLSHLAELTGVVRAIWSNCNKVRNATLRGASSIITPLMASSSLLVNVRLYALVLLFLN